MKKCLQCNGYLHGKRKKFCSLRCKNEHQRTVKPLECARPACKNKFKPTRDGHVFCSKSCAAKKKRQITEKPKFVEERSIYKRILARAIDCEKCPLIDHCNKAVKIGLWVACEDADEHDIRRMQSVKPKALVLLNERMQV